MAKRIQEVTERWCCQQRDILASPTSSTPVIGRCRHCRALKVLVEGRDPAGETYETWVDYDRFVDWDKKTS